MEITEIKVSDLYSFKQCPLRYELVNVKGLYKEIDMNEGLYSAVQSTLSYFYYNLQDGRLVGMQELKEKFGSIWYGKTDIYSIKMESDKKQREQELTAIGMLQSFHRTQKYTPDKVAAVNLDFRVPFGDSLTIRGKIPLIRETARGMEIVNFKTGTQKYDEFWQNTDMEITLQAMAYHSMYKKEIDSIAVHNLRNGQTYFLERKSKHYKRLYKSINMMKKSMEEGWYYPRESFACDKCPVKSICQEW